MLLLLLPNRNVKDLKLEAKDWKLALKNAEENGKIGEHDRQFIVNPDELWNN